MTQRLLITLAVIAAVGCGDAAPGDDPVAAQAAENARAIAELRTSVDALTTEIRRQDRQRAGLGRDVASLERARKDAAAARAGDRGESGDSGGDPSGAAPGTPPDPADPTTGPGLDEAAAKAMLETEAGRKAIAQAAAEEVARREAQERRTFVSYTIGRFATRAGLTEHETEELQGIWKDSLDKGSTLRGRFAAIAGLPEADRKEARDSAMEFMREIGRDRNERIRALLSTEQFALYEDTEDEIVDSLHGGPRRAPGRRNAE